MTLPSKFNRDNTAWTYWKISQENFVKHIEYLDRISEYFPANLEKCIELDPNDDMVKFATVSIVFAALYLEAEAYNYIAINKGDSFAKNLDKLPPIEKWVRGIEEVTGKQLSVDSTAYKKCNKLFKYRNKVVHKKSKPASNFDKNNIIENIQTVICEAKNSQESVMELAKLVLELHPGPGNHLRMVLNI